jgi:hypothetical protein
VCSCRLSYRLRQEAPTPVPRSRTVQGEPHLPSMAATARPAGPAPTMIVRPGTLGSYAYVAIPVRAALGAERVEDWPYPPNADVLVVRDPDGNEFCVIDQDPINPTN